MEEDTGRVRGGVGGQMEREGGEGKKEGGGAESPGGREAGTVGDLEPSLISDRAWGGKPPTQATDLLHNF